MLKIDLDLILCLMWTVNTVSQGQLLLSHNVLMLGYVQWKKEKYKEKIKSKIKTKNS